MIYQREESEEIPHGGFKKLVDYLFECTQSGEAFSFPSLPRSKYSISYAAYYKGCGVVYEFLPGQGLASIRVVSDDQKKTDSVTEELRELLRS